jgi:hypothetical protein
MLGITGGDRTAIIAGADGTTDRKDLYLNPCTGEEGMQSMSDVEDLISAGRDKYVQVCYKQNRHQTPMQICVNIRKAILDDGQKFAETISGGTSTHENQVRTHAVLARRQKL